MVHVVSMIILYFGFYKNLFTCFHVKNTLFFLRLLKYLYYPVCNALAPVSSNLFLLLTDYPFRLHLSLCPDVYLKNHKNAV